MTANKRNSCQPLRRKDPRRRRSGEKGPKSLPGRAPEKVKWWDRKGKK